MSSGTAISRWLQKEMPKRGYPLEGHRAGGISRLAEDADIPQASMSRLVGGRAEPSLESLRKIGQVLGYSFGEMLVHAGIAKPGDLTLNGIAPVGRTQSDLPAGLDLRSLPERERHIWLTPGISIADRRALVHFLRLRRGELDDDGTLIGLMDAIREVVSKRLGGRNGTTG